MRNKITIAAMVGLFLVCFVAVPVALAQEPCNLQTLTGTYAIYEKGSALFVNPTPSPFPFYSGIIAPFVNVTELTFSPDGVAEGFFWIRIGAINGGLDPIPVHVTVTEMKADCTGKLQYSVNLPGLSAAIEERIIVFDNGREFRSIPTSIQSGIDSLAWTGTGKRISKSSKPVHSCGPQTAHGTYLLTAENIIAVDPNTAVADALVIREDVSLTGDYTGTLYEKIGPVSVETPALGTLKVNPDCSFAATLKVPEFFSDVITMRGVFFNGGKEYYALAIDDPNLPPEQQGIKFSFAYGKRISQ
jgi:hypothetical protein